MELRDYMLIVSRSSAVDRYTNTWSLFHLVEELDATSSAQDSGKLRFDVEVHCYFHVPVTAIGMKANYRMRLDKSEDGSSTVVTRANTIELRKIRHRVRTYGLLVPSTGHYELRIEWKFETESDSQWKTFSNAWPLHIRGMQLELGLSAQGQSESPSSSS